MIVTFKKSYNGFNAGEHGHYSEIDAKSLIARGIASIFAETEKKSQEMPEVKSIESTPIKKSSGKKA